MYGKIVMHKSFEMNHDHVRFHMINQLFINPIKLIINMSDSAKRTWNTITEKRNFVLLFRDLGRAILSDWKVVIWISHQ